MNLRRLLVTVVISSLAVVGTVASASAARLEPVIVDTTETKSGSAANIAVDHNGVVWANSRWNPMVRTTKLERYRVSSNGTLTSLRDVRIRGLNPMNVSVGNNGLLFISDTLVDRVAVVTLSRSSAIKALRYIKFNDPVTIFDAGNDSSGKIYVLVHDGIYILSKRAKNDRAPLLRIDAPFTGDDKALAVTDDGTFFVADEGAGVVYAFGPGDEEPIRTFSIDSSYAESGPRDLVIGNDGLLYVSYSEAGIASFNLTANGLNLTPVSWISTSFGEDFLDPQSIDVDSHNHMVVGDFMGADGIKVLGLPVG